MVQIRSKMKEVKKALINYVDASQDQDAAKVRAKFMDRWAKISNCPMDENGKYDYSQIDYDNEFVQLEWQLCDARILFKVTDEKHRAEGIMMLPPEVRETFYKTGPENSKPYSEIYMGMSKLKHTLKREKKNSKKGKHSDEPESIDTLKNALAEQGVSITDTDLEKADKLVGKN